MTLQEIYFTYEELKKEGYSKEKLFCATCRMFLDNNLDINDLNQALKVLGYKLSDELLSYDKEKQNDLIDKYVKAFALQYDLEEFK